MWNINEGRARIQLAKMWYVKEGEESENLGFYLSNKNHHTLRWGKAIMDEVWGKENRPV